MKGVLSLRTNKIELTNGISRFGLGILQRYELENIMSKRESLRQKAERRRVSHGTIFRERKSEDLINKTGEDLYIVYAWRWSGDDMHAKIGHTLMSKLESRMVATYHPTDDPVLIGIMKCDNLKDSKLVEKAILNNLLQRTRPDREWVITGEWFNKMIDEVFISDPNELHQIFGEHIKTRYRHDG